MMLLLLAVNHVKNKLLSFESEFEQKCIVMSDQELWLGFAEGWRREEGGKKERLGAAKRPLGGQ
jgi:hypothetical protein